MSKITDYIIEQEGENNLMFVNGEYQPTPGYLKWRQGTQPLIDTLITKEQDDDFIRDRESWVVEQFELSLEEIK